MTTGATPPRTDRPVGARDAARRQRREAALALRPTMSPAAPAPDAFRVATWNVNSLRARAASVRRLLARTRPDVLLLQETKASELTPDAAGVFGDHGYTVVYAGSGAYNGVAIAARHELHDVQTWSAFGRAPLDREPRLLTAIVDAGTPLRVASVYVPHGRRVGDPHYEYKLAFLDALAEQVRTWLDTGSLVLGGDVNVAPTDSDVFHPNAFVGRTHVTEPERRALAAVLDAGLVDLDAHRWGADQRRFTWWQHGFAYERNLGMRIDLLAADPALAERLLTTWIDHTERGGERPSDHAAVFADFEGLPELARPGA